MANAIVAIFCGLSIMAGWYYLSRSQLVEQLQPFESPRRNRIRRQARRLGAMTMIVLSIAFFYGFWLLTRTKEGQPSLQLLFAWFAVVVLLFILILCVSVDVYLTARIRNTLKGPPR